MSISNDSIGPKLLHEMEQLLLYIQLAQFDQNRHLPAREKQYCTIGLLTTGIFIVRETEDGWWRESIDAKGDVSKQIDKLKADPTVACGWINQPRFDEPGGWYDPS